MDLRFLTQPIRMLNPIPSKGLVFPAQNTKDSHTSAQSAELTL